MNKTQKRILKGIAIVILLFLAQFTFKFCVWGHSFESNFNRYLWLFKDSEKAKIDTFIYSGKATKTNTYYTYIYDDNYFISIWEFKDLREVDLKNILITQNVVFDDISFFSAEKFNAKLEYFPIITSKLGFRFKESKIDVNLDDETKIYKKFDTINYKGFFGKINLMSFNNYKGKPLIYFQYLGYKPTLFIMYKAKQSFFVIMVDSKIDFDDSIIKIFNLK